MQLISIPSGSSATPLPAGDRAADAFTGVIACMGSAGFASDALVQLNRWLPVSWWSVFQLHENAPPAMPASGSYRAPDHTVQSWQVYRTSLYQKDQTFLAAREKLRDTPQGLLVHWHAHEIPHPHRQSIYTRHGLRERLSVVRHVRDGSLLAINLYRHEDWPPFTDTEIEWIGHGAGMLASCVQRHLELAGPTERQDTLLEGLTHREREVCERMLKGWTYDGIAMDLRISAGTVKTYRDRAFDRLGIHHRNELFALVIRHRTH